MTTRTPSRVAATLAQLLMVLLLWIGGMSGTVAQTGNDKFDHVKTGFPLLGQHSGVRCESCHVNGVFKGTPRDCASCHVSGNRLARGNVSKPVNHFPTQQSCDSCHNPNTFTGANFDHVGVAQNSCSSCHNGSITAGKPSGHIPTQAACGTCHKTNAWLPATGMDHSGFTSATNCASCHNGASATGKSGSHIPTAANCISCHSTKSWKPSSWNHSQMVVAKQCSTCHTGGFAPADGPTANHIPYKSLSGVSIANCDTCHRAGYASWNPGAFHANVSVSGQCATCHLSSGYGLTARPATAIHAGQSVCETCHKTTASWISSKPDHGLFTSATNCSTCHNGSAATGKPGVHIPTTVNCVSCHSTSAWRPTKWNHSQVPVAGQCSTCHSGAFPPADGWPANHIPYASLAGVAINNCDTCHRAGFGSWNPGVFHTNVSVNSQCSTCHMSASYGLTARPATAIHSGQTLCESCHKSTSTWLGSKPDHGLFTSATNCSICHNGSAATGKSAQHIPTAVNCVSCHSTTAWRPAKWNHSQMPVVNQCSTCHNGAYPPADGRPLNHIPYTSLSGVAIPNCDTCHKGGYASWFPGAFHKNVSVATQCSTCHLSGAYGLTSKPATTTHASVTGNCESCHRSTSSWLSVQYTHSPANAVGTGTCDTCHNGTTNAVSKPAGHIPVPTGVAKCDSCHRSQVSFATAVSMNHGVVTTASCKSCHNGSYLSAGVQGALAKPVNHIPEAQLLGGAALDCNACHTSTTSWISLRMNHNASQGGGAGWCKACHATGTSYLGNMDKKALNHDRAGKTDCSESGCHRPLGNKGTPYTKWN
ncbi:cytochrome c3 family protein [Rhodoferax mekongensis]|uniref:cytochrome c3 family protein n=1 Tax=Rhodoferax mekongensis TaxID=3068341 RepID=UPI0028BF3C84|nr:cytochrome c3 family protein [Rhodoferax sp. TBRC 17199]MDT7517055.1 cytochrome c3 family protein [Rhodoferax sp. TBRC 17199]